MRTQRAAVRAAFDVRPNDLLKWQLILWLRNEGKRRFVLGGGYSADDGIFRYKRSFAPHGLVPFFVGRRVLQQELYNRLTGAAKSRDVAASPKRTCSSFGNGSRARIGSVVFRRSLC